MAMEEYYSGMLRQRLEMERAARWVVEPMLRRQRDLEGMVRIATEPMLRQRLEMERAARGIMEPMLQRQWDIEGMVRIAAEPMLRQQRVPPVLQGRTVHMRGKIKLGLKRMQLVGLLTVKTKSKSEDWAMSFGWFIPRKYRTDIVGDILEDSAEMREAGCTERRIKFHVVWQWLIVVITLVPAAVKTSIVDAVKQVISRPK